MSLIASINYSVDFSTSPSSIKNQPAAPQIININDIAIKIFASAALIITNSLLSVSVGSMKLLGFTVLPTLIIGFLSTPLHKGNMALAKYSFKPFQSWAKVLNEENTRITKTKKVLSFSKGALLLNVENYKTRVKDSFKAVIAPLSTALTLSAAIVALAAKPTWLLLMLPGFIAEPIAALACGLAKLVGQLTYTPLANASSRLYDTQTKWMFDVYPKQGF
jgi:hypothetical protein